MGSEIQRVMLTLNPDAAVSVNQHGSLIMVANHVLTTVPFITLSTLLNKYEIIIEISISLVRQPFYHRFQTSANNLDALNQKTFLEE